MPLYNPPQKDIQVNSISGALDATTDFSIILYPDQQFMWDDWNSSRAMAQAMTTWVLAQKNTLNIQAVLGLGDVSNSASATAYGYAKTDFQRLFDAGIAGVFAVGNHDYDTLSTRSTSTFDTYLGGTGFYSAVGHVAPQTMGFQTSSSSKNFWAKFTAGAHTILVIVLETYPEVAMLSWAQSVIDADATATDIIFVTHAFLNPAGLPITDTDDRGPSNYALPNGLSGVTMWNDFVRKNEKLRLVVNGHYSLGSNFSYLTSVGDAGNLIHQVFIDYQDYNYGDGIVGIVKLSPANGTCKVSAYSTNVSETVVDEITLSYGAPKHKDGAGVVKELSVQNDLSAGGQILARDVRAGSQFAEEKNTSVLDLVGIDSEGDATIDPPDNVDLIIQKWHGTGETYAGDGNGGLGNHTAQNHTATFRCTALEHYNGFLRPRTPVEGGTINWPDIDPPTFGGSGGYDDIAPPALWDSCMSTGEIEASVGNYTCGSFLGGATIWYRAFSYIDIPGVGRYYSSTYTEFSLYDCSNFDVLFRIHGIPTGATGIEIWRSTDGCGYYYYGDIVDCQIDPCYGYFEFWDMWSGVIATCGTYPYLFLPYGGGEGGDITLADYPGCYVTADYTFYAYSYMDVGGTRYYSSTYGEATINIALGDCQITVNSLPTLADGIRLIWLLPGCCDTYYYYDFDSCAIGSPVYANSLGWSSPGSLPESPLLPTTTGSGCADTVPNNSIYRSVETNKLRYKDNDGSTFDITMTAI